MEKYHGIFPFLLMTLHQVFHYLFLPHFNQFISSLAALVLGSDHSGSVGEAEKGEGASVSQTWSSSGMVKMSSGWWVGPSTSGSLTPLPKASFDGAGRQWNRKALPTTMVTKDRLWGFSVLWSSHTEVGIYTSKYPRYSAVVSRFWASPSICFWTLPSIRSWALSWIFFRLRPRLLFGLRPWFPFRLCLRLLNPFFHLDLLYLGFTLERYYPYPTNYRLRP